MWAVVTLIVLFISSPFIDASLPKIDLPWILQALNRTCVVLVVESGFNDVNDQSFRDLLTALKTAAFEDDDEVSFGTSTYSDLISDPRVKIKSQPALPNVEETSILVLERRPPDRSCLLAENLITKELKASSYKGRLDLATVLHFVNDICGTYKTVDGGVTKEGKRRQAILENLYSTSAGPTMKTIWDTCAGQDGRLKEFFYTGLCGEEKVELSKCEVVDGSKLTRKEFFDNYLSRSKPVVLKNLLKSVWPNSDRWTNEFFREKFGDQRVDIKLTPTGEFEGVEDAFLWTDCRGQDQFCVSPMADIPAEVQKHLKFSHHLVMVRPANVDMSMVEFLHLIENRSRSINYTGNLSAYLEYTPVGDTFVGLEDSLPELPFVKDLLKLDLLNMWLSNGNTLGKLHFDQYDNFLCQVSGKKRLILFEPHNNTRLYEGHIVEAKLAFNNGHFIRHQLMESTALTMAPLDIEKPDFKAFPEFAQAIPLNCTIEEGDILFLPSFWWHEVQSYPDHRLPRNLAFNFWYDPFLQKEFPCIECKLDVNQGYRNLL